MNIQYRGRYVKKFMVRVAGGKTETGNGEYIRVENDHVENVSIMYLHSRSGEVQTTWLLKKKNKQIILYFRSVV